MNFEDYYNYDVEKYDGFVRDWQHLISIVYYSPFEKSRIIYKEGDGSYYMYDTEEMYWDESLIFKL